MKELKFRDLTAEDVEVRVARCADTYVELLIYKDARVDQAILDETVGPMNWKKDYKLVKDNLYCTISIYDSEKHEWIEKCDCGVESNTEKEKGEASDAQKRAGFVWGIGRELYTAPKIYVNASMCEIKKSAKGTNQCYTRFSVSDMKVENKKITSLDIINAKTGELVFSTNKKVLTSSSTTATAKKAEASTASVATKQTVKAEPEGEKPQVVKTASPLDKALDTVVKTKSGKDTTLRAMLDASTKKIDTWEKFKTYVDGLQSDANEEIAKACKLIKIAISKGTLKCNATA